MPYKYRQAYSFLFLGFCTTGWLVVITLVVACGYSVRITDFASVGLLAAVLSVFAIESYEVKRMLAGYWENKVKHEGRIKKEEGREEGREEEYQRLKDFIKSQHPEIELPDPPRKHNGGAS